MLRRMKSHDCTRLSERQHDLPVRIRREARVCVYSHTPRYGIYTPLPSTRGAFAARRASVCVHTPHGTVSTPQEAPRATRAPLQPVPGG
eukprot:5150278-Prymnesium_polylepis.1